MCCFAAFSRKTELFFAHLPVVYRILFGFSLVPIIVQHPEALRGKKMDNLKLYLAQQAG
jgi:hypothetical protein